MHLKVGNPDKHCLDSLKYAAIFLPGHYFLVWYFHNAILYWVFSYPSTQEEQNKPALVEVCESLIPPASEACRDVANIKSWQNGVLFILDNSTLKMINV